MLAVDRFMGTDSSASALLRSLPTGILEDYDSEVPLEKDSVMKCTPSF